MAVVPTDNTELAARARELAAAPDAAHWAQVCGWVPGTGHCRDRACAGDCLFHPQRDAEAQTIRRDRRRRRGLRRCR
jgi:hypothetical protein